MRLTAKAVVKGISYLRVPMPGSNRRSKSRNHQGTEIQSTVDQVFLPEHSIAIIPRLDVTHQLKVFQWLLKTN